MIELRKSSKDEMQGDVQSSNNANTGSVVSNLQQNFKFVLTEY
jgi:hypothetical protein